MLLIYDSDFAEQNRDMRSCIEAIEEEGKRVTECLYVDKKQAMTSTMDCRVVTDRKCFDWLHRPTGVAVCQLMENGQFDIVIDVSGHQAMRYITMAVRAKMKCGRQDDSGIFDFQIEGEMSQEQVLAEVVRYLKMINK